MEFANPDLRRFYAQAALLEPSEGEVARVIAAVGARGARPRLVFRGIRKRGLATIAFALIVAAFVSAAAYPGLRDALDSFFNGGSAPGVQVAEGSLPPWLIGAGEGAHPAPGSQRLIAEQHGERMYGFRDAKSGRACVVIGTDSDTCSDASEWQQLFAGHELVKLASGVGPTADGRVAVYGLARSAVTRVEIRDGDTVVATAPVTNGGWIVVAPQGRHDTLVGLDASGKIIERVDASSWTWSFCQKESGCSP